MSQQTAEAIAKPSEGCCSAGPLQWLPKGDGWLKLRDFIVLSGMDSVATVKVLMRVV